MCILFIFMILIEFVVVTWLVRCHKKIQAVMIDQYVTKDQWSMVNDEYDDGNDDDNDYDNDNDSPPPNQRELKRMYASTQMICTCRDTNFPPSSTPTWKSWTENEIQLSYYHLVISKIILYPEFSHRLETTWPKRKNLSPPPDCRLLMLWPPDSPDSPDCRLLMLWPWESDGDRRRNPHRNRDA